MTALLIVGILTVLALAVLAVAACMGGWESQRDETYLRSLRREMARAERRVEK